MDEGRPTCKSVLGGLRMYVYCIVCTMATSIYLCSLYAFKSMQKHRKNRVNKYCMHKACTLLQFHFDTVLHTNMLENILYSYTILK